MRVKFGSLVTEGHGSLGGHTIQNSNYGAQLRSKPVNKKAPSFSQSLIRSFNSTIHAAWRALSASQQQIWIKAAPPPLSGSQFWYQCQFTRLSEGLPFLKNPANRLATYLGYEMINQTLWNKSTMEYWDFVGESWSADNTKLITTASSDYLNKYEFWQINHIYKCVCNIEVLTSPLRMPFDSTSPSVLVYSSNIYTEFYSPDDKTRLTLRNAGGSGYYLSLSIKEVFNYNG
jgi:hypothetical protein